MKDLNLILSDYEIDARECIIQPFGTGLINNTWKITHGNHEYILQRINTNVFRKPQAIAENIACIAEHLHPHTNYLFPTPLTTRNGDSMINAGSGYFRLMPFVKDSFTHDVVKDPSIAYEAASQFGLFTRLLSDMDTTQLKVTIPQFHDLSFRYQQFEEALNKGNAQRISACAEAITFMKSRYTIVKTFEAIKTNPGFKVRATHHDTKISNVLFDKNGKGLCVIDLDTTMPGYFISDVGDMMRTYLPPVSEEEKDLSMIGVREEFFTAIARGYLQQMQGELSPIEKEHFVYAGSFLIYMQALRFLTDHLNDDMYYGAKYEGHNLVRANNQATLLKCYEEKQDLFDKKVSEILETYDKHTNI